MEYLPEDDLSEQSQRHSYVRITNVQRLTRPQISAACTTRPTNSMPPPSLPKKRKSLYRKPAQELWSFHPMTLTIDEVLRNGAIWAPVATLCSQGWPLQHVRLVFG